MPTIRLFPIELDLSRACSISQKDLTVLSGRKDDLKFERLADGSITVRMPNEMDAALVSNNLSFALSQWSEEHGRGEGVAPDVGYALPDGSVRGTGPSWVRSEQLDPLSSEELEGFLPFAPDFAADVISIYQTRESYVERFESFLEYGCRLAWLFDPKAESVDVFRPGAETETIEPPATLSADPVLPRFSCTLGDILDPAY
jgi:Uma2 family endonuclease